MEAHAVGLPIVASTAGGITDVVQHGESGLCVPPADPAALADALEELVTHPERWEDMGAAGRAHVISQFSIDTLNDRLVQYYHELT